MGSDGVEVPVDEIGEDGAFHFGHLRPGAWIVRAADGDRVVAEREADVRAGETVALPAFRGAE